MAIWYGRRLGYQRRDNSHSVGNSGLGDKGMKMCHDHWDKLRAAIDERGIGHLVARDGKSAMQNLMLELEGRETEAYFDPLMAANNMIMAKALELGGLYLMTEDANGIEYCPVCEAIRHNATERDWINGPADAVLEMARSRRS